MVNTCFLCKWRSDKLPRRSFHKFPSNEELKLKWLDILGQSAVSVGKRTSLCSLHFEDNCFRYGLVYGTKILKEGSLPSLHLTAKPCVSKENSSTRIVAKQFISDDFSRTRQGSIATSSCSGDSNQAPDPLSEIPEGRVLVARVYHYLRQEYEQLKCGCDLSPLSDALARTARATGLSADTVAYVIQLEKQQQDDDDVARKRQKLAHDYYDCDSPIKEEPEDEQEQDGEQCETENADYAPTDDTTEQMEQHDLQIEFKAEPDDEHSEQPVVYHTEDREQDTDPLTDGGHETRLDVSGTSDVDVKIEPPDIHYTQSSITIEPCTDGSSDVIKTEPSDDNHYTI